MKKTIPSIRIEEETKEHIDRAIKKYNDNPKNLIQLTLQEFRRLALELLSQMILQDKQIPFKLR